ncbi:MAG TPA: LCP family protein [Acidimicrobiia bacterium]|nr:LCP family protein [Acidimicrobiia bacterium]
MRRLAVGLLAVAVLAAGVFAADLRRAHDAASLVLQAVDSRGAAYDPGEWKDTVFVLAIGSDERVGLDGARADALHVIGMNPRLRRATIINIPRDTWVEIPGHGQGRVNEAYRYGGAQLQAETVRRLTGAPISFTLTTTFDGVVAMVDRMGGLEVDIPFPMDDRNSGAAFHQGRQRMTGTQVLAFSRNRYIPDGDIRRTANQGQVLIHALEHLRRGGTSGTEVLRSLDVLYRNVRAEGVKPTDLYRLGRAALRIEPANVRNYTIPVTIGFRGSQSVVFVRQPAAARLFEDFVDDAVLSAH